LFRSSYLYDVKFFLQLRVNNPTQLEGTELQYITSHHIEETEAGLKGLYIREITTVIDLLIRYY